MQSKEFLVENVINLFSFVPNAPESGVYMLFILKDKQQDTERYLRYITLCSSFIPHNGISYST